MYGKRRAIAAIIHNGTNYVGWRRLVFKITGSTPLVNRVTGKGLVRRGLMVSLSLLEALSLDVTSNALYNCSF